MVSGEVIASVAVIGSAAVCGPGVVFGPGAVVGLGVVLGPGRWPLQWESPLFALTHCNSRHFKRVAIIRVGSQQFAAIRAQLPTSARLHWHPVPYAAHADLCGQASPGQTKPSAAQRRPAQPSSAQTRPAQANSTQHRPAHASPTRARHSQASSAQPRPTSASPAQVRPTFMKQNCFVCNIFLLFWLDPGSVPCGGPCGGQRFSTHGR